MTAYVVGSGMMSKYLRFKLYFHLSFLQYLMTIWSDIYDFHKVYETCQKVSFMIWITEIDCCKWLSWVVWCNQHPYLTCSSLDRCLVHLSLEISYLHSSVVDFPLLTFLLPSLVYFHDPNQQMSSNYRGIKRLVPGIQPCHVMSLRLVHDDDDTTSPPVMCTVSRHDYPARYQHSWTVRLWAMYTVSIYSIYWTACCHYSLPCLPSCSSVIA